MGISLGHKDFSTATPNHNEPIDLVRFLELLDVSAHGGGEIALGRSLLNVRTVEPFDITAVKNRRPGFNLL